MAAQTLINGVAVPARTSSAATAAVAAVSQGVAVVLEAAAGSEVAAGGILLQAQYSADAVLYSDPVNVEVNAFPDNGTVTKYALIPAPAGVSVKFIANNTGDAPITVTLIALAA